ncbi:MULTISPECIES: MarR family winged helix-turn-helix transcriptional regulator [Streptomyces]|uniref:MarR family winged helix-turn-helix transcriptional regulator n=1 Tax=Streptomyces TaxID=1883 RepID=UPI0034130FFD
MRNSTGHDIADALGLLLRRSTRARRYTQLTEGLGEAVDDLTYPVLSGLARAGACSAADLGREIGLDRTTVTRRADRLEQAGLLQRRPDPADGRATLLALTEQGHNIVSVTRQRLAAGIESSLATWPQADAQAFARRLRRFVDEGSFAAERH